MGLCKQPVCQRKDNVPSKRLSLFLSDASFFFVFFSANSCFFFSSLSLIWHVFFLIYFFNWMKYLLSKKLFSFPRSLLITLNRLPLSLDGAKSQQRDCYHSSAMCSRPNLHSRCNPDIKKKIQRMSPSAFPSMTREKKIVLKQQQQRYEPLLANRRLVILNVYRHTLRLMRTSSRADTTCELRGPRPPAVCEWQWGNGFGAEVGHREEPRDLWYQPRPRALSRQGAFESGVTAVNVQYAAFFYFFYFF